MRSKWVPFQLSCVLVILLRLGSHASTLAAQSTGADLLQYPAAIPEDAAARMHNDAITSKVRSTEDRGSTGAGTWTTSLKIIFKPWYKPSEAKAYGMKESCERHA